MALSTQARERVSVSSMPGIAWDKASGGDRSHNSRKARATAGGPKQVLSGDSEIDNVITEAFIDPVAYDAVLQQLHAGETFPNTTVARQFIDAAEVPVGQARRYFPCSVAKFSLSDADANGEEGSKLIVEWTVGG